MRRKNNWLAALFVMCLLFSCGCSASASLSGDGILIYRVLREQYQTTGELLRTERISPGSGSALERVTSELMSVSSDPQLDRSLPRNVRILSSSVNGSEAWLEMSAEYLELRGMDKTLADCCITLSLCQLEEIESVTLCVDGQPVSPGMTSDDCVLFDSDANPYEKRVRLYFLSEDGRYLTSEYHSLTVPGDTLLERVVMEELLRGPYDSGLRSALPEGCELVSVSNDDGLCTVTVSWSLPEPSARSRTSERLAVYAVVNSLTSLQNVDSVRLESNDTKLSIPLDSPLTRNDNVIGPAIGARGEEDIDICVMSEDGALVFLPVIAAAQGSFEEYALTTLMDFSGEPGYIDLFPEGSEWISSVMSNGFCVVTLPPSFFESRSEDELTLAGQAIALTLSRPGVTSSVLLRTDSGAVSSMELRIVPNESLLDK